MRNLTEAKTAFMIANHSGAPPEERVEKVHLSRAVLNRKKREGEAPAEPLVRERTTTARREARPPVNSVLSVDRGFATLPLVSA